MTPGKWQATLLRATGFPSLSRTWTVSEPTAPLLQFGARPVPPRSENDRQRGCPAQPVSRFAPLEAWANRTTSRLGVHSILSCVPICRLVHGPQEGGIMPQLAL